MSRRGEAIYKRKDGRWEARYVGEIRADGTKKYVSVYAATYKGVKEKRRLMLEKMQAQGTLTPNTDGADSVAQLAWEWLASIRPNIRASTYQKYESLCKNHIVARLGDLPLQGLTRNAIRAFAEELETNGRVGGGALSRKTVNDCLTILGLVLAYAGEEYEIAMPRITMLREERKTARVLSAEEERLLVKVLLEEMDCFQFGVLLALYTGIRIGELCALQWADIDADSVHITKTMQRLKNENGGTTVVIGDPKSSTSRRIIPLPAFLQPYVTALRSADGFVLHTSRSPFMEPRVVQDKFKRLLINAGIAPFNFHTLRHTFATRCIEAGFDAKTLSELLGHTDVKITLNRYVHSSYTRKKEQMQKLSLPH